MNLRRDYSLSDMLGGHLPTWISQHNTNEVRIDAWRDLDITPFLTAHSRLWINDGQSEMDDCAVFVSGYHPKERADWLRDGIFKKNVHRPIGGVDEGVACASFEGIGIFTSSAAGPTLRV